VRNLPIPKVSDIKYFKCKGPWDTKSGGALNVLFAIPDEELAGFFVKSPISGFRIYQVSNPEIEKPGGMEWHIYRQEIVLVPRGRVEWIFEDTWRNKIKFVQDGSVAVWIPGYIVHSYKALDECSIIVIANTLYDPDDPETYDTYVREKLFELIPK